jgi:hypothetical protein
VSTSSGRRSGDGDVSQALTTEGKAFIEPSVQLVPLSGLRRDAQTASNFAAIAEFAPAKQILDSLSSTSIVSRILGALRSCFGKGKRTAGKYGYMLADRFDISHRKPCFSN